MYLLIGQIAIPIPVSKEAVDNAGIVRPGELLMLLLTLSVIALLLAYLKSDRKSQEAARAELQAAHNATLAKKDTEFATAVDKMTSTVLQMNQQNHDESNKARGECHSQGLEMVKGTAVVAEMARDVKESCSIITAFAQTQQRIQESQKEMLDAQQRTLHDMRGVMQTTKSLAEVAMMKLAQTQAHHVEHEHKIIPPPRPALDNPEHE